MAIGLLLCHSFSLASVFFNEIVVVKSSFFGTEETYTQKLIYSHFLSKASSLQVISVKRCIIYVNKYTDNPDCVMLVEEDFKQPCVHMYMVCCQR